MSDAIHRFVVTMPCVTGLPEDKTENVFSVGQNGVLGASDLTDAIAAVRDFYITAHAGQVNAVGKYIGQSVSRAANACTVSLYSSTDLTGATPFGSPTNITAFTMSSVLTSNALPEEVAAVISYRANLTDVPVEVGDTRPAQRRRGRVYVGPLNDAAGSVVSSLYRPDSQFRTDLGAALKGMAQAINATASLYFGVWSKADAEVWEAIAGYVDDAWDTQRRRGVSPTTRTGFTI